MRTLPLRIAAFLIGALCVAAYGQTKDAKTAQMNEAKGLPPRAGPGDYQTRAQVGAVTIAADFLGHSVPREEGPLSTDDYVVIETAFFGPAGERLKLSLDDFSLRLNGKKKTLSSEPYELVDRSIKDPAWSPPTPPGSDTKSKSGFNTGGQDTNSPPPVVHVPIELQRSMAQHLQRSSLPEGDRILPQAGLIFFEYRGKTRSLRSIELVYNGPAGKATLNLQP